MMLEKGKKPDVVSCNTLLMGLCNNGKVDEAMKLFSAVLKDVKYIEPDVITFNCLIQGLCKEDQLDEAAEIYNMMIERGISGNIQSAEELLKDMFQMGLTPDAFTYSIIINRFSKLGQLEQAKLAFDRMISSGFKPSIHVYDSLLKGFSSQDEAEEIINLLRQMADEKIVLDPKMINTILNCLCHSSLGADVVKLLPTLPQKYQKGQASRAMSC
ncbi:hypothetical protein GH714_035777 [Hevea brasiliensis]|uniref:Pentacotripeptide-repeat region of PRORP domain-containing protein n=1 Tax=Hevea brasiliensis TaxID=3981 RepID=A0A6A6KS44_HEVBR|nr:hypothetical protein GH714_035777 [Hevea brasiliensis]